MPVTISGDGGITGLGLSDFEDFSGTPSDGQILSFNGDTSTWSPIPLPESPPDAFDSSVTVIASDASWSVPELGNPIVKVTVIGGGGGASGANRYGGDSPAGGSGGNSTFNAGEAGTLTSNGGIGGVNYNYYSIKADGRDIGYGIRAANFGTGGLGPAFYGLDGVGGELKVGYFNLDGISTVNITIGSGGAGGLGTSGSGDGGDGGHGAVIVEYKAAS